METRQQQEAAAQNAIARNRGEWDQERTAALHTFIDAIVAMECENVDWQQGTRGLTRSAAYREGRDDLDRILDAVREEVQQRVQSHMVANR